MESIIKVSHLSKSYKDVKAVDDISFTVNRGDVYGFLGPNGAGKSTTIRMLLTLIAPSHGSIEIFGKELSKHRHAILSNIGAVIERPDLYKYLSGFENLELFARMSGVKADHKTIMEQLDKVGLSGRAGSKVRTYSQGMKQRLGIAVALVHDPELIILDEPTNGLDPQGIADIRNLVIHLSKDLRKTVLVSSHLLSEVEQIANRMFIIHKGRKMVEGSVQELFDKRSMMVEVTLTNEAGSIQRLHSSGWGSRIKEERWNKITFDLSADEISSFTKDLVSMDIPFTAITPRHSLEDYFLKLTSGEYVDLAEN